MNGPIDDNATARDAILARVRAALGKEGDRSAAVAAASAYVEARAQGPRPAPAGDLVERFLRRATDMESTVERVASLALLPKAIARYVDALDLDPAIAEQKSRQGVCWPEFADLDWEGAGLGIEARATNGQDRLAVTGTFCAIAETGTLVITSGHATPTASALLPDTHIAVVRPARIVAGMEEAFALVRAEHRGMPRAVNLVSGPSRTGDIEQTIVVGAHGPFRVHIVVVG